MPIPQNAAAVSVVSTERADILDVLRGIAIGGILLNNILNFSGYSFMSSKYQETFSTYPVDRVLLLLQHILVEGKFYSIFSLLFGIGFAVMLIRVGQRGINPLKIFYRRLTVLIALGSAHALLLWDGDILLLYGLIGLFLPLFRDVSDKGLLVTASVLILSPLVFDAIRLIIQASPGSWFLSKAQALDTKNGIPLDPGFAYYLYKEGSGLNEWRNWLESGIFYRYEYILNSNRIVKVLGMFLIGYYVGRKGMYQNLETHKKLFVKIRNYGLALGLIGGIAKVYFELDGKSIHSNAWGLMDTLLYAITVVPLALAYVSTICLLWIKADKSSLLHYMAAPGRMALTNYLMQSIVCIALFYGVGLGLGTRVGPAYLYPIALFIFAFQVLYSNYWFRYFSIGPLEWIWRQLTYLKRLPIRKLAYAQDS